MALRGEIWPWEYVGDQPLPHGKIQTQGGCQAEAGIIRPSHGDMPVCLGLTRRRLGQSSQSGISLSPSQLTAEGIEGWGGVARQRHPPQGQAPVPVCL